MTTPEYGVDSIHINVLAGDAAVHLQLQLTGEKPNGDPIGKPWVLSAVLIDGGDFKHSAPNAVQSSIYGLSASYDFKTTENPKGVVKIDSVIVTHWDRDHHFGLNRLIALDLKNQFAQSPAPTADTVQISFFKYNGAGRTGPRTILYCPTWDTIESGMPKSNKEKVTGAPQKLWSKTKVGDVEFLGVEFSEYLRKKMKLAAKSFASIAQLQYHGLADTTVNTNLLGMNFFTQVKIPRSALPDCNKPDGLLAQYSGLTKPGMFCVAVQGRTVYEPDGVALAAAAVSPDSPEVIDRYDSATNASSISAMIIFPAAGSSPLRIAHYFAGDAEYGTEESVVKWTGAEGVSNFKTSHHGSAYSTPLGMLEAWKPKNIVISAGAANGHPRWELVTYFYYHYIGRNKANSADKPQLYPTCYPYWFGQSSKGNYKIPTKKRDGKDVSTISTAGFNAGAGFRTWVEKNVHDLQLADPTVYSIVKGYDPDDDWSWEQKGQFIAEATNTKMWDVISRIPADCYPEGTSHMQNCTWIGPNQKTKPVHIKYVRVKCRADPAGESTDALDDDLQAINPPRGVDTTKYDLLVDATAVVALVVLRQHASSAASTVIAASDGGAPDDEIEEEMSDVDEDDFGAEGAGGWDPLADAAKSAAIKPTVEHIGGPSTPQTPGPAVPLVPDFPSGNYYYCCDQSYPGSGYANAGHLSGLSDTFVSRLHMGWISVAAAPTSPTQDATVLSSDEVYTWFKLLFGGTPTFTLRGDLSDITRITLETTFAGCDLTFSTDATPWTFGLPDAQQPPTSPPAAEPPVLYSDDMLILGLSAVNGTSTDLSTVCEALGLQVPAFLDIVGTAINLDLLSALTEGNRNAVWFMPTPKYQTVLRLGFGISGIDPIGGTDPLNHHLFNHLGLMVYSANITVKTTHNWAPDNQGHVGAQGANELTFSLQVAILPSSGGLTDDTSSDAPATIEAALTYNFQDGSIDITVICDPSDKLQNYVSWIEGKTRPTHIFDYLKLSWLDSLFPRRVTLNLAADHHINSFQIDFEITAPWGNNVVFLFTFSWSETSTSFRASLWPGVSTTANFLPAGMTYNMLPTWEDYEDYHPHSLPDADSSVSLLDLLGGLSASQLGLPNQVIPKVVSLSLDLTETKTKTSKMGSGDDSQIQLEFYALLGWTPPSQQNADTTSTLPSIDLGDLGLDLQYILDKSSSTAIVASTADGGTTDFQLELDFGISIFPRSASAYSSVTLTGSVNHSWSSEGDGSPTSTWQIYAELDECKVANLVEFFEPASQDGVMDLVEHIDIKTMALEYDFGSDGNGSHFLFQGTLLMGIMEFDLQFEHWTDHWSFAASLTLPDQTETINSVLGYLTSEVALPSFIGNINLTDSDTGIFLNVWKTSLTVGGQEVPYIIFQTDILIDDFSMTFIQYNTAGWKRPKRVFRAALSGPLHIPKVPVVDSLTQPFDEMYFLYVQDASGQTQAGILRQEFALLNEKIPAGEQDFMFKETHKPVSGTTYNPLDVVIPTGLRFDVVITENGQPTVVLDHAFGSTDPAPSLSPETPELPSKERASRAVVASGKRPAAPDPDPDPDSDTSSDASMAPMQKTIGPLTISNIGVQYKNGHLIILLDATFEMGPIALELLGFGLDLDFTQVGASLKKPPSATPQISGLGFGYSQPPVEIAGTFERINNGGTDLFVGGVVVTFQPYLFLAAGCYGFMSDGTKTVAVFALLEGPLVELEFAEITGICGGFGYNSSLRWPTVDSVTSYPLVDHAGIANSPLDTINNLLDPKKGCISVQKGSIWLAAGLDVNALKMIDMDAVVAVEFTASDVKLGIFGDVRLSFPSPAPPDNPDEEVHPYVYVELEIVATVDFGAGTLLVEAQLAPTSFILDPSCHLTGGFAMGYWFGSNQHAGDWVVTVGGYHPVFSPPSYYPNPDRLAISWSLDDSLGITGQAYFALTPKAAMGGGELRASLSLGPLSAYFDAYADFLIKFSPFYFIGDVGVDIGVSFTLDLWICTIHINVDINAELYIQGPPVHGYVHVDFWVFGFDIYFGEEDGAPDTVALLDFYYLLKQSASNNPGALLGPPARRLALESAEESGSGVDDDPGKDTIPGAQQLNCVGGLLNLPNQSLKTGGGDTWSVRAGPFQFTVSSPFPSDKAAVAAGGWTPGSGQAIYGRPMQSANPITSSMVITVTPPDPDGTSTAAVWSKTIVETQAGPEADPPPPPPSPAANFRIAKTISKVPASMWSQYTSAEDPLAPVNQGNGNYLGGLLDGVTKTLVQQMMSVTVTAPKPYWPPPDVEPLAAFKVADASGLDVVSYFLSAAPLDDVNPAWNAASPEDPDEWEHVPRDWRAPRFVPSNVVDAWAWSVGWKKPDLWAGAPEKLVTGFDGYYMAVPQMTAEGD